MENSGKDNNRGRIVVLVVLLAVLLGVAIYLKMVEQWEQAKEAEQLSIQRRTEALSALIEEKPESELSESETIVNALVESANAEKQENSTEATSCQTDYVADLEVAEQTDQIIVVIGTGGSSATLSYHTKNDMGIWNQEFETTADVGKNGISSEKKEGDGKTPAGCYGFDTAFGIKEDPGAQLAYKEVLETSYWVDDIKSPFYNTWKDASETEETLHSEHLIDHNPSYNYALNISYNPECVQGKGSAIFLHCKSGEGKTTGCIAIEEALMMQMVQSVDTDTKIVIVEADDDLSDYMVENRTVFRDSDMVDLNTYLPEVEVDLKYATTDNISGKVIYDFEDASLRYKTLGKLALVEQSLEESGFRLKIWDAYRPVSAQFVLWEAMPDPKFVANPNKGYSSHSRGNTVDVTLVTLDGEEVVMPSSFDDFSALADRDYSDVSGEAAENALLLETAMEAQGFVPYNGEWWHFEDEDSYEVFEY